LIYHFSENHYISASFILYPVKGDSKAKLKHLKDNLQQMNGVAIAFSGGVDSTFLLKIAHEVLGDKVVAITGVSLIFPKKECNESKLFAKSIGVRHILIDSNVTDINNFSKNPIDRCYYCKKELFSKIKKVAKDENIRFVLDGSNADDVKDYRPGFKAIKELGVISPLKDAGLTKQEIRDLSKEMDLGSWDKPAFACLASRFPYGTKITKKRLEMVEKAEEHLQNMGVKQYRVRFHDDIARIEVLKKDFKIITNNSDKIAKRFKELGFKYVTLDIQGYRTGSLNEVF